MISFVRALIAKLGDSGDGEGDTECEDILPPLEAQQRDVPTSYSAHSHNASKSTDIIRSFDRFSQGEAFHADSSDEIQDQPAPAVAAARALGVLLSRAQAHAEVYHSTQMETNETWRVSVAVASQVKLKLSETKDRLGLSKLDRMWSSLSRAWSPSNASMTAMSDTFSRLPARTLRAALPTPAGPSGPRPLRSTGGNYRHGGSSAPGGGRGIGGSGGRGGRGGGAGRGRYQPHRPGQPGSNNVGGDGLAGVGVEERERGANNVHGHYMQNRHWSAVQVPHGGMRGSPLVPSAQLSSIQATAVRRVDGLASHGGVQHGSFRPTAVAVNDSHSRGPLSQETSIPGMSDVLLPRLSLDSMALPKSSGDFFAHNPALLTSLLLPLPPPSPSSLSPRPLFLCSSASLSAASGMGSSSSSHEFAQRRPARMPGKRHAARAAAHSGRHSPSVESLVLQLLPLPLPCDALSDSSSSGDSSSSSSSSSVCSSDGDALSSLLEQWQAQQGYSGGNHQTGTRSSGSQHPRGGGHSSGNYSGGNNPTSSSPPPSSSDAWVQDWLYLLKELSNCGQWEKALACFHWLLDRPSMLQGSRAAAVEWPKLVSTMVAVLGRHGAVDAAQHVFERARSRGMRPNVYAYSALISAFARSGRSADALSAFARMRAEGCRPNLVAYNAAIDACAKGAGQGGLSGLRAGCNGGTGSPTGNGALSRSNSGGSTCSASSENNINNPTGANARVGGSSSGNYSSPRRSGGSGAGSQEVAAAWALVQEMTEEGIEPDRITFNSLIATCSRAGMWQEALRVFELMGDQQGGGAVTQNGHGGQGRRMGGSGTGQQGHHGQHGQQQGQQGGRGGIERDVFTYNTLLDALCKAARMEDAAAVFARMAAAGVQPNVVTYSTMIDGYRKAHELAAAVNMFDAMRRAGIAPDRVTFNTLVDIYGKAGRLDEAVGMAGEMERAGWHLDVVTFNALVDAFGKEGRCDEALQLVHRMRMQGVLPNALTLSSLVGTLSRAGRVNEAVQAFQEYRSMGVQADVVVYSALMDAFGKAGMSSEASSIFQDMLRDGVTPNVVAFNSLIDAIARSPDAPSPTSHLSPPPLSGTVCSDGSHLAAELQRVTSAMERAGVRPNVVTFAALMAACCRLPSWQQAASLLHSTATTFEAVTVETVTARMHSTCTGISSSSSSSGLTSPVDSLFPASTDRDSSRGDSKGGDGGSPFTVALLLLCGQELTQWMGEGSNTEDVTTPASKLLNPVEALPSAFVKEGVYVSNDDSLTRQPEQQLPASLSLLHRIAPADSAAELALFNALLDLLWRFGQHQQALAVVQHARHRGVYDSAMWRVPIGQAEATLDLHVMSVGAALSLLHLWLLDLHHMAVSTAQSAFPQCLHILTGWGRHSKVTGLSVLKSAVDSVLASLQSPFAPARYNEGRYSAQGSAVHAWLLQVRQAMCLQDSRPITSGHVLAA